MSYQVLARKWRPRNFQDLVGQQHVVQALANALDQQRLHHAYLFSGTRGVGKTTLARILSKCLNCEQGVSATPCGECTSCREIDQGRFVDLLEVDAASRTKVDQTRELLENVPFAPVRGRYKVYLIDEVHMFSQSSFNALLKTLEEPPSHVKFLLATTDPQKVPVTVLSRCLQFNLKLLLADQIEGQLGRILQAEGVEYQEAALSLLARAAEGSMRDALSLLDQAISFAGGRVDEEPVRAMLGTISRDLTLDLLGALAAADGAAVLDQLARMAEFTPDFTGVLRDLLSLLHRIALLQQVPGSVGSDDPDGERLQALAAAIPPEDAQLYYQVALLGQQDLPLAPDPRTGIEMVLLRMLAFRPEPGDSGGDEPAVRHAPTQASPAVAGRGQNASPPVAGALAKPSTTPVAPASVAPGKAPLGTAEEWHRLVEGLAVGGIASQLVRNCVFLGRDGNKLRLGLDPSCRNLRVASAEQRLRHALTKALGDDCELVFEIGRAAAETPAQRRIRLDADLQRQAEDVLAADPVVRSLEDNFAAQWVADSIRPADGGTIEGDGG